MRTTAFLQAVNPSDRVVSPEHLAQYGAMGTIIHKMAEMALRKEDSPTKLWSDCKESWDIIQKGDLHLDPSKANPRAFIASYNGILDFDFSVLNNQIEVTMFDDDIMVKGTTDLLTKYNGEWCIADWKTSRSYSREKKEHYFKQLAMYAYMIEKKMGIKIKYLVILPLNPSNDCGYGKPIITDEVEKYQQLALKDLETFNKKYGNRK